MPVTVSQEQLNKIIYSYHHDPFEVLGAHVVKVKGTRLVCHPCLPALCRKGLGGD